MLGPLGQSTTAVEQLADAWRRRCIGAPYAVGAARCSPSLYGVPVMGFALLWLALAAALVVRAARDGMRFAMTWWAFTFPVGTCVTGAAGLARHTGLTRFDLAGRRAVRAWWRPGRWPASGTPCGALFAGCSLRPP